MIKGKWQHNGHGMASGTRRERQAWREERKRESRRRQVRRVRRGTARPDAEVTPRSRRVRASREASETRSTSASRNPAIWRPLEGEAPRKSVTHGDRSGAFVSWRVVSFLIVLSLSTVLALLFTADAFYVHSISVGGLDTMTSEEVFALTGVANLHVFWVDPVQVREELLRSPTIADARVTVGWPPSMVQILIEERDPALVWEQAGVATWIDLQGRVMRQRADRSDLIRVAADPVMDGPPGATIQREIVIGAIQLSQLFPELTALRYHPDTGLGFNDSRGWVAWFGTGEDITTKVLVYNALAGNLLSRGILPSEINVTDADNPFYSTLAGR